MPFNYPSNDEEFAVVPDMGLLWTMLLWIEVKWSSSVVSDSLWPHRLGPTRLLRPRDFPGKSTGVGCHFLLQRIFPTQGSNPGLPHCRQTLYHLSHQGSLLNILVTYVRISLQQLLKFLVSFTLLKLSMTPKTFCLWGCV